MVYPVAVAKDIEYSVNELTLTRGVMANLWRTGQIDLFENQCVAGGYREWPAREDSNL